MNIRHRLFVVKWLLFAALVCGTVAGCGTVQAPPPIPVVVQGNGKCVPAVDLPAHKTMKKLAAVDAFMEDVYGLLGAERHDHAADIKDYNSLYDTCVGVAAAPAK